MNLFLIWFTPFVFLFGFWVGKWNEKANSKIEAAVDPAGYYGYAEFKSDPLPFYEKGDPPGTYRIPPGSELHAQVDQYMRDLIREPEARKWHPGRYCGSECWEPGGHRQVGDEWSSG
jgi:hypothetical protein